MVSPGLEGVLARELASLGLKGREGRGGASFRGGLEALYRANLWLRTASRVLVRVGRFRAAGFRDLVERTARYPWEIYLPEDRAGVRLRVTCRRSRLYHSGAVAERVLKGIETRLGRPLRLSRDEGDPLVVVRLFRDEVLLRVDASGRDLFRRGYKVAPGPAPLRENLAAALVLLSGWSGEEPLLDPFCGTGTIVIEAALIAARAAPGLERPFAFESWRNFDRGLMEALREEARRLRRPPRAKIRGSDLSPGAVEAARRNAQAAGVEPWVELEERDFRRLSPPARSGVVVTNPPYGERLARRRGVLDAGTLAPWLPGWKVVFLCPGRVPPPGLRTTLLASFDHGGRRVFAHRVVAPAR